MKGQTKRSLVVGKMKGKTRWESFDFLHLPGVFACRSTVSLQTDTLLHFSCNTNCKVPFLPNQTLSVHLSPDAQQEKTLLQPFSLGFSGGGCAGHFLLVAPLIIPN
jgi:hypothetical protein